MEPAVSVVIPTCNRPDSIRNCLAALSRQSPAPGAFEVIVVDDGSSRPLELDPGEWAYSFDLRVIRQENRGPAAARNRGVAESRCEILVFTDDDCIPIPDWLEHLVAPLNEYPDALVGGATFNGLKHDLCAETSQIILDMVYDHFNRGPKGAYFLASNNFACRRDAYLTSGGFDADFFVASEDRDFCDRWRMLNRPLLWAPDALVEHRHAQTLWKFVSLHYRYGRGAYLYQVKRRERNSGTMQDDLGFHRSIIRQISRKLFGYSVSARVSIAGLLIVWQIANAVGFFRQAITNTIRISGK